MRRWRTVNRCLGSLESVIIRVFTPVGVGKSAREIRAKTRTVSQTSPVALCLVLIKMSTHAYKRFVERYGYEIPRGDIRLMEAMIAGANLKSPNAVCLGKRTRYRSEWLTMYKDVLVRFAYSNKSGTIITFLPVKAKHTVCWEEFKHLRSLGKKSRYVCKQCGRFYNIRSDKAWVKFFCTAKNKNVHLVRYKSSESI